MSLLTFKGMFGVVLVSVRLDKNWSMFTFSFGLA